ncbi:MAG: rhodanese-like domain-containing protein, partial [Pseudomonadota bacterium]
MERERTMKHLTPQQAYEALQADPNALLIDTRTEIEFWYVGHPVGAINVEWQMAPDFEVNPHFVEEVQRVAVRKDRPIILIC